MDQATISEANQKRLVAFAVDVLDKLYGFGVDVAHPATVMRIAIDACRHDLGEFNDDLIFIAYPLTEDAA